MKPSFVRAAIFLKLLQASMACGAAEFEPVFVTSSGQSSTGNGVRVAIAGGCATITAAHIIANSATPVVSPPGSGIAPTRVPVDDLDEDIAIIHQKHTNPDDCIPPPSTDVIRKALLGTSREAWTVSGSGDARLTRLDLVGYNEKTLSLRIQRADDMPTVFTSGMSGSVVVFDGVPVGYLKSVKTDDSGIAQAVRLDYVMSRYPQAFPRAVEAKAPDRLPYDLTGFPSDIKKLVEAARRTKARVIRVVRDASEMKQRAENAAAQARTLPLGVAQGGHARFKASNGNYYEGQVFTVGTLLTSQGFGVSEIGEGESVGNRFLCSFIRDKGCNGFGVLKFADNEDNASELDEWVGTFKDDKRFGLGYLRWHSGGEAWYFHDAVTARPGVWKEGDGRLFEGEIGVAWNGSGVLWDKDGGVIRIGSWKDGQANVDRTSEIR